MRLKCDMLTELSQCMADFCWQTRSLVPAGMFVNTHQVGSEGATAQGSRLPLQQSQQTSEVHESCRCPATITAKYRHAATY